MDGLTICKPGAEVVVMHEIAAVVRAVMIEPSGHVSYKIAWIVGTELKETWVDDFMVNCPERSQARIGFRPSSPA